MRPGKCKKAIEDFNQALRLLPNDFSVLVNRGNALQNEKELTRAIADYDQAIRIAPHNALVYVNRGNAWDNMNELDKALDDYKQAIRLNPKCLIAYLDRAGAWIHQRQYDKAAADINEAMRIDPKFALCYYVRANLSLEKNAYNSAITDYDEALRLDPKLDVARYCREVALDRQQQITNKITVAESKNPSIAVVQSNLSVVKQAPKEKQEHAEPSSNIAETIRKAREDRVAKVGILEAFDKVVREAPKDPWARINLGDALSEASEYEKAIADYEKAIELDPSNAIALDHLARIRATCDVAKFRDGAKAVEAAKKACELNEWNDAPTLDTLAAACAEAGDFAAALKWETKAVESTSDSTIKKAYESRIARYRDKQGVRR